MCIYIYVDIDVDADMAVSVNWGPTLGCPQNKSLLFAVFVRALDVWKLPYTAH